MKETTKPNTSHLVKRDLAVNIAVLPLPTPPAGARGEGRGSAGKFETRNSTSFVKSTTEVRKSETNSKLEIQETSNVEHRTSNFELTEGTGRGPALINTSLQRGDGTQDGHVNCFNSFSLGSAIVEASLSSAEAVDLQFPRFMDIAVRRDEPLSLSPINEQILTLTTDCRLPNV
jgi:hypothetical protein